MLSDYYNYLISIRGYSPLTAQGYLSDIRRFVAWARDNMPAAKWSAVSRKHIDAFITFMVGCGLKPATTNRVLSGLSSYYNYMIREGYDVTNPVRTECRRRNKISVPTTIPTHQLKIAYNACSGITHALLGLLATTGIRIQEALDLTWDCVDTKACALRIHGKGNKQRIVFTTSAVVADIMSLNIMGECSGLIFHLDQRAARYLIYSALRPYCVAPQLSPHAIRHTFATQLAISGVNATTIAKILGHNCIQTTQRYIDMSLTEVKSVMQFASIL